MWASRLSLLRRAKVCEHSSLTCSYELSNARVRRRRNGEVKSLTKLRKFRGKDGMAKKRDLPAARSIGNISHAIRVIKSIRSLYIYHQSATGRGWRRRSRRCLYHRSWLIMQAMVATFNGFNNGGARCARDAKGRHKSQE